jgi:glycosyltransferase domain-containing protein
MLRDVALIVPTRDRPHFVHRLLSYHAKSRGLQIILGDGSKPEQVGENRRIIQSFSDADLDIIHYVPSQTATEQNKLQGICSYFDRQVNAARLSSRKYIYVGADDDFVSPEFLGGAASFLDANPDFSAVTGYLFSFRLDGRGVDGNVSERTFTPFRSTARPERRAADRIARYEAMHFTNLDSACVRRDVYNKVADVLLRLAQRAQDPNDSTRPEITTFTTIYVYDLVADHLALAYGKIHWLPRVQQARHHHDTNLGGKIRFEYKANLGDSFVASNWPGLISLYFDALGDALVGEAGMDRAAARRVAEGGLALRAGPRLSYEGKLRLAEQGDAPDELPRDAGGGDLRRLIQVIPGMRSLARAVYNRIAEFRAAPPKPDVLPADVNALFEFLNQYRRTSGKCGLVATEKVA